MIFTLFKPLVKMNQIKYLVLLAIIENIIKLLLPLEVIQTKVYWLNNYSTAFN